MKACKPGWFSALSTAALLLAATPSAFGLGDTVKVASGHYPRNKDIVVTISISNSDTLQAISLPLIIRSVSGGAWGKMVLPYDSAVHFVGPVDSTDTLGNRRVNTQGVDETSPDSALIGLVTAEPPGDWLLPGPMRPIVTIALHTDSIYGTFEIDSGRILDSRLFFVDDQIQKIFPAFIKGIETVQPLKGDLNGDGELTSADVVLLLNLAFLGILPPEDPALGDMNCDGVVNAPDVVLLLNLVFLGSEPPC